MPLRQEKLEAEFLVKAMSDIRDRSTREVAMMHHEAERLFDWREYVRFKPLFAVAASAFIGYSVVKRFTSRKHKVERNSQGLKGHPTHTRPKSDSIDSEEVVERATTRATITSGITGFVGSLASSAIRVYLQRYIREQLGGSRHDFTEQKPRERSFERDKIHYN